MAISLVIKLILSAYLPLTLDEFYYYLWGKQLSLSYFDHPPMIGWIFLLAQPLEGLSEGFLRWPSVILSHFTIWVWFLIVRNELDQKKDTVAEQNRILFWFLLVAQLNPLWGVGALIATPDIPLLFFWSLSLYYVQRILVRDQLSDWVFLGIALGLGFVSKYQIVLFVPALFIMLVQQKKLNQLFSARTLVTIAFGLIACLPVLIWNSQNEWASFLFQWNHGMASYFWKWHWPLEYVASQVAILLPIFLFYKTDRLKSLRSHWLFPFAIFPFLFFLYSSFKGRVEANWTIMAFASTYALYFIINDRPITKAVKAATALWGGVVLVAIFLTLPERSPLISRTKLYDSEKLTPVLQFIKDKPHVFAYSYQMASYLSYHQNKLICKFSDYGRKDHFSYIKGCLEKPSSFFYVVPSNEIPPLEKDWPEYRVVNQQEIDQRFTALEVEKR